MVGSEGMVGLEEGMVGTGMVMGRAVVANVVAARVVVAISRVMAVAGMVVVCGGGTGMARGWWWRGAHERGGGDSSVVELRHSVATLVQVSARDAVNLREEGCSRLGGGGGDGGDGVWHGA